MGTILTATQSDIDSMVAYAGQLFTDLNLYIVLAIGLPLAFWVIRKVIGMVRAR